MDKKYELPYGLLFNKVFDLLEEIKKKPRGSEEDLRLRFGKAYSRTKSTAIEFQLITIQDGWPTFTTFGKNIAWETNEERKQKLIFINIILKYLPYEIAITRMIKQHEDTIFSEFVQQVWAGDMGIKLGTENLSRAVSMFFQVLDYTGLGNFYVGRRGAKTRFVFLPNAKEKISSSQLIQTPIEEETQSVGQDLITELPKEQIKSQIQSSQEIIPSKTKEWSRLETDFFILRIEKTPDAWDLLKTMMPLYRKKLKINESEANKIEDDEEENHNYENTPP